MQLKKEPKKGKKRGFFSRRKDEETSIDGSAVEVTDEVVSGTTPATEVSETSETPEPEGGPAEPVAETELETSVDQTDHGQDGDQPWSEVTAHLPDEDEDDDEGLADASLFADGEEQDESQPPSQAEGEEPALEPPEVEESAEHTPTSQAAEVEEEPESPPIEGVQEGALESPPPDDGNGNSLPEGADSGILAEDPHEPKLTPPSEGDEGTLIAPAAVSAEDGFALSEPPTFVDATEDTRKGWVQDTSCCRTEGLKDLVSVAEGSIEDSETPAETAEPLDGEPASEEATVPEEDFDSEEMGTPNGEDAPETIESPETSDAVDYEEEDGDSLPPSLETTEEADESHLVIENRPSDVDPVTSLPREEWDSAVNDDLCLAEEFDDEDAIPLYTGIAKAAHALPVTLHSVQECECPICGEVHKLLELSYDTHLNKGGTPVTFASVHDYCVRREVIFTTEKRAFQNYTAMCDAYKKGEGLLTGEEISAILNRYGMTPENFDTIFDWDAGATSSFIAGDTQNLIHDGVIRKVGNEPIWFYGILLPCDKELSPEDFSRIEEAARAVCEGFDPEGLKELLTSRDGGHSAISGNLDNITDATEETPEASTSEEEGEVGSIGLSESDAPTENKTEEADSASAPAAKPKKERRPIFGFLRRKRKETEELKDAEDPFEEGESEKPSLPEIDLGDPEAAAGALSQYDENGVIQPKEVKRARDEYHPAMHTAEEDDDNTPPTAPLDGQDTGDEDLPPDPEEEVEDGDEEEASEENDGDEEESNKHGRFGRKNKPKKESRRERRKRERAEAALLEEDEEEEEEEEDEDDSMNGEDYEEYEAPKDTAKDVMFFLIEILIGAAVTTLIGYQVGSVYLQNLVSTYLGG